MSQVLEDLSLKDLLLSLLGEDFRKRLENRSKTNAQLYKEYCELVAASKSGVWVYETKRLVKKFFDEIGEFPPSIELFIRFFQRYSALKPATRQRYYFVFSSFFSWYSGEKMPFKIRVPKPVPQKVDDVEIDKLIAAIRRSKKTHTGSVERDVLLIETIYNAGLRRSEASNLTVADLHLSGDSPTLLVRQGKGGKDRLVNLNPYIRHRLMEFTRNMKAEERIFPWAPKTISGKITSWARMAGVPELHTHSLRHKFATDILDRGGNIRNVQQLMGHESLGTTEVYLAVTNDGLKKTVGLLDKSTPQEPQITETLSVNLQKLSESLDDIKKQIDAGSPSDGILGRLNESRYELEIILLENGKIENGIKRRLKTLISSRNLSAYPLMILG
jgi:site-specific recombinase XerD